MMPPPVGCPVSARAAPGEGAAIPWTPSDAVILEAAAFAGAPLDRRTGWARLSAELDRLVPVIFGALCLLPLAWSMLTGYRAPSSQEAPLHWGWGLVPLAGFIGLVAHYLWRRPEFPPTNAGCAWELGQLLDRVPLSRVTLLVNDSTDLACLDEILSTCARSITPGSPNLAGPAAVWRVLRIGGLATRSPQESHFQWRRRIAQRLDAARLVEHLLASARPLRSDLPLPSGSRWWHRQSLLGWPPMAAALLYGLRAEG
ncbi:hypothetical protein ACS5PK_11025 [Roseateles sp. DB2]|uniref:hypothetical protein n=1 Tax=Roseateles sp. DB2 TaxID=3453717 RepID=UPI003EEFAFCC